MLSISRQLNLIISFLCGESKGFLESLRILSDVEYCDELLEHVLTVFLQDIFSVPAIELNL